MKIIVRPRQMGKTTELILIAEKTQATIICRKCETAKSVKRMALEMGCNIPEPTSYTNTKNIEGNFLIDNADWILSAFLKIPQHLIVGIAMDGVPEIDWDERQDIEQWEEFRRTRPDLTYKKFCEFKYNMKLRY